jgi:hypothetical protein
MISVYLDTYNWMNLAEGKDRVTKDFLAMAVQKKIIRLPLSLFHCREIMKAEFSESRDRVWRFAVSLSRCAGLLVRQCIEPDLIEEAVSRVFRAPRTTDRVDPFTDSGLFGLPCGDDFPLTEASLRTPNGWVGFWLEMPASIREKIYSGLREYEQSFIDRRNKLKTSWRNYDYHMRRRAYAASLLLDHQQSYRNALNRIGKSLDDIETLPMEKRVSLVTEVAPWDVEVALATQHQQQWDRPEKPNDICDIGHLCMAVPYCDVVVTERYWVDKLTREKMDRKYNTRLLSDISELPGVLRPTADGQ